VATSAPPISPVVETKRPRLSAGWLLVGLVGLALALRLWHLGQPRLFFDETFEAMVARRSLGPMLDFLRAQDQHPPLDYLLRAPFAATGSDIVLRLPSVVWSTAAIAVFAVWMRARGKVGCSQRR
jgi:predicted membrane-bound mannosyltransferase